MSETFIYTIAILVALGVLAALVLYFVAQKFKVYEDPRIDGTEAMLPGANCGGCGYPGCRGLAVALVEQDDISDLFCPVGGVDVMNGVASYLGKSAAVQEPRVAVVRCGGSYAHRAHTNRYDGAGSCAVIASLYGGPTGCSWGCLGQGDCVRVCKFGALAMDPVSGLPVVDKDRCTACGACVVGCPKSIIELRRKGGGDKCRDIFVNCVNHDKGAVTRRGCEVGCIGCGACVKVCPFGAIQIKDNLAYIDPAVCKFCRKCAPVCPTGAIVEVNFPVKKVVVVVEAIGAATTAAAAAVTVQVQE